MIYTAICGNIDPPRTDIQCFTDPKHFSNTRMSAKLYKALPHLFFDNSTTVWIDGNIFPLSTEQEIIEAFLPPEAHIGCFLHPYRTTIRQELETCLLYGYISVREASELTQFLGPQIDALPLYECGVLVRRNLPLVNHFNALWWSLICRFTVRDQITFPAALAAMPGIKLNVVQSNVRNHPFFAYKPHCTP